MIHKKLPSTSKFLNSLSRPDLETLLSELYDRYENVRNFIDLRLTGKSEPLVKKYKKLIKKRLIEDIEEGSEGLQEALNAVREFSEIGASPRDQADVMLWFVESAVYCIDNYGDLYEDFYDETENLFEEVLDFMKHYHLLNDFKNRCKKVVEESADTGYGFHESLGDSFYTYFQQEKPGKKLSLRKPIVLKPVKSSKRK